MIGHLTSRLPRDLVVAGQMLETRRWWDQSRHQYNIFLSALVMTEISRGDPIAAAERRQAISGVPMVPFPENAGRLADDLVHKHGLPAKARTDAMHVAICAMNSIDFLLTWNCRHLANANQRKTIIEICRKAGYNAPNICTPPQLRELKQ